MPYRLEISLNPELTDAEGQNVCRRAKNYLGIQIENVRTITIVTIDADLSEEQLETIQKGIFTNPVIQYSSYTPLPIEFDWCIWVGFRPGVRDNPGSTGIEAIEDILGKEFGPEDAVYTSKRYCLTGKHLTFDDMDRIAGELLANDIIQQWKIYSKADWQPQEGIGYIIPKVMLQHVPEVTHITLESDIAIQKVSDARNLALNPNDIPTIRHYFKRKDIQESRGAIGLSEPTDVELEYISQARSDHCNHNTFRGLFRYSDMDTGVTVVEDNLFKTYIQTPTLRLKEEKDWVISVLWDNAGVARFDANHHYVITGETHNSPSNMEAYGGAITGIVGVYRDPMGTGKGAKLVMGSYGFCVGHRDYNGPLRPRLHPRRLLDGIIEGVKDGGNKSGIPTTFGQTVFDSGYMGKCLVFVTAVGLMPARINGNPAEQKKTEPGDMIVMCGGWVGKDGIHGVTASSESFSEHTPAGHVQIGDPYTQKKMHDFLLEARDNDLISFITDNGGGGLSSSVGESAQDAGGCEVWLEKIPLKYEGLDPWEIWVSESQERMTVAVKPDHLDAFMDLSKKHAVDSNVIGVYTDSGKLHLKYNDKTCAYIDLDLLESGFPQWEFEAQWRSPQTRGLYEPVIREPLKYETLLLDLLARPNICSKEWINRQYDHEVQGGSVIKPLVGREGDIPSDASVIRPVLDSEQGLAFSQAILPYYSAIDAYHMTTCTIDEAVRRLVAVGADPSQIGGVDNFCWPDIQFDPDRNPDGKFKAAQLVRACRGMRDMCLEYEIPLLSGKDSMYVDGHLTGPYGETRKVSALETLQFSATSIVDNVLDCLTLDAKMAGDYVYILGMTYNELGGSEYYGHLNACGVNVPEVRAKESKVLYKSVYMAIKKGYIASAHGVYRGGIGIHLAMIAMAGSLGLTVNLKDIPTECVTRNDTILFSESAGRFIVTIPPDFKDAFEKLMAGHVAACIGKVIESDQLVINGIDGKTLLSASIDSLKAYWKRPFGELI